MPPTTPRGSAARAIRLKEALSPLKQPSNRKIDRLHRVADMTVAYRIATGSTGFSGCQAHHKSLTREEDQCILYYIQMEAAAAHLILPF